MIDSHIHSPYCAYCSYDKFEDYVENFIKIVLKEIELKEYLPLSKYIINFHTRKNSTIKEEKYKNIKR